MKFNKPHLSVNEQIDLLIVRGLIVEDRNRAFEFLSNISYYRLTAYSFHFQKKVDEGYVFHENTTFEKILKLYFFDRELRLLIFDAIERIEIALRTQISYHYSLTEPWWFETETNFDNKRLYINDAGKIYQELDRSKEQFIKNYKKEFDSPESPPSWMTIEVFSMGLLSKLFSNLKTTQTKKDVTRHFKIHSHVVLESWLQCLTYVRNICAHHCRIWDRTLTVIPKLPEIVYNPWLENTKVDQRKLYAFLSLTIYLLKVVNPSSHFTNKVRALIEVQDIDLRMMGFPNNWEEEPLWKPNTEA